MFHLPGSLNEKHNVGHQILFRNWSRWHFYGRVVHLSNGKVRTMKLLSEDPERYSDAPREGIRRILKEETGEDLPRAAWWIPRKSVGFAWALRWPPMLSWTQGRPSGLGGQQWLPGSALHWQPGQAEDLRSEHSQASESIQVSSRGGLPHSSKAGGPLWAQ